MGEPVDSMTVVVNMVDSYLLNSTDISYPSYVVYCTDKRVPYVSYKQFSVSISRPRSEMDTISGFITQYQPRNRTISNVEMYTDYVQYCQSRGVHPIPSKDFMKGMETAGFKWYNTETLKCDLLKAVANIV